MKDCKVAILGACCAALLMAGCATPPPPSEGHSPKLTYFSKEKLDGGEIKLPAGFSKGDMTSMVMGVAFKASDKLPVNAPAGEVALPIDPNLSTRFQTEMDKMKRFTMVALHGVDDAEQAIAGVADMSNGNIEMVEQEKPMKVRLVLQGTLLATKARTVVRGVGNQPDTAQLVYKVYVNATCKDLQKGTVAFSEVAVGKARPRMQTLIGGRVSGGFDAASEKSAIWEAAQNALIEVCNKLGNTYPSGGHIIGVSRSGDRMTLDKGLNEGIGNGQQCCIVMDDGGVMIPLAIAEAVPSSTESKSELKVWRWNEADPDAKEIYNEFKSNPRSFFEKNNNALYGCGYGLPVPPEWELNATK